ncbi:hypothetical protein Pyn_09146 [Prunus yedoensis var. nudiflora]|uniref:Uncharacterized protein n=1 Tax=Prunus yedoensis var. nudiflora TaxID=2094558 RepID=A0A314V4K3_PRUYE|nr:hypothetical protein Pyn_09146 [Prunus yedoensis var. nudiflora]
MEVDEPLPLSFVLVIYIHVLIWSALIWKWGPQICGFPSKAEALKLWSWVPVGIGPSRLLYETLKSFKKLWLTNDNGIIPDK